MGLRLALETSVARAIGGLSRAVGRGGGTTLPGKVLWKVDPGAVDALAARLPDGVVVISATNGKTTTTAMAAEILGEGRSLAWNRAGANLLSGIASALVAGRRASSACSKSMKERSRRRSSARNRGSSLSAISFATSSIGTASWSSSPSAGGRLWRDLPAQTTLVVNADDAVVADLADGRPGAVALRTRRSTPRARKLLPHAADSKYCVRCGAPVRVRSRVCGPSRRLPLPELRAPSGRSSTSRVREIELRGLLASRFRLVTPEGEADVELGLPGLYNVYNAAAAAGAALAAGASLADVRTGLERFSAAFGRFERIPAGGKSVVLLLVKNPAGANEVVRTLETGVPPVLVVALNDAIADGQDVSWIWDVDFEPLLEHAGLVIVSGDRAAELGLRMAYGGLAEDRLEVIPSLEQALDRGLGLLEAGTELVVLPTYTAMLALRGILSDRGAVRPYWEEQRA